MKRLAVVLLVAACTKDPAPTPAQPVATEHAVIEGPTAAAGNPANLPGPGTAPPPVVVPKEIPMWNASIRTLQGKDTKLADYGGPGKGKALLLVNVASKCGLTKQYTQLEALQKKYAAKGFTVIGFPCNQFGGQEPGSAEEIQEFCSTTYGVTFPMMEKVDVNGPGRHEIYKALTPLKDADGKDGDIRWNFEKFVISADGTQITRFNPQVTPDDPTVIAAIENALPK